MKLNKLFIAFYLLLFLGGFLPALAQDLKRKHIILVLDTSYVSQNRMVEPIQAIVKEVLSRKKSNDLSYFLKTNPLVLGCIFELPAVQQ